MTPYMKKVFTNYQIKSSKLSKEGTLSKILRKMGQRKAFVDETYNITLILISIF